MKDEAGRPAERAPALTEQQLDAMRAELFRLRRDLHQVQNEFNATHAAQLLQANEQLVLAALKAERIAETAAQQLNDFKSVTQRDPLTDTPNRALMLDRLQHAIMMAKRRQARMAVLFVDIDRFKQINDTQGHAVGDKALQLVARRLEAAVRDSDTVSRHSGDEFLVLLEEISQAPDAGLIATKMLASLAAPEAGMPAVRVRASIGIAIFPDDGDDPQTLIDRADAAMYQAKRKGGGRFAFHGDGAGAAGAQEPSAGVGLAAAPSDHPQEPDERAVRDLRAANEQLILSSLALHESEANAVQAYQRQVKFLAMVAHELRDPLTPIRTAAELLSRVRTDDEQHARLQEMIKRQAAHMARIVDDLLDGSRVGLGAFQLKFEAVELKEILDLSVDACRPGIDAREQQLTTRMPDHPMLVRGDPVRLAQVFRNLLENASKYTHRGGNISLKAAIVDDAIVVAVADDGIGIAADALPRVFDLFVRGSRAAVAHRGGLGIGLAVVRELVEAHRGSVVAISAGQDLGSEFVVTLPSLTGGAVPG